MDQLAIDVNERSTIVALLHEVGVPEFVVQGFTSHENLPF
jgi:hypothetical protein